MLGEDRSIWGVVQINYISPETCEVAIRFNASVLQTIKRILEIDCRWGLINYSDELCLLSGFFDAAGCSLRLHVNAVKGVNAHFSLQVGPKFTEAFNNLFFLTPSIQLTPLILIMGFLYCVSQLTRSIAVGKELHLCEAMLIMGLSKSIMYSVWFILCVVQYRATSLIMSLMVKLAYLSRTNQTTFVFLYSRFSLALPRSCRRVFWRRCLTASGMPPFSRRLSTLPARFPSFR
ncbi:putative ATP-binding cassette protein subfamily A,member 2 [Trypanosoma rangeli]|uniref:Putative ATP-binding cassette protein subfamily A,member 2 n=1 Tax=Trypanosoma rangeli TaxID=5698 RepID=A0A422NRI2_TRYRA|nr:putative ATP-binding cassette protein subfamily A,member 2 [Trypanosoma rangeli]RNF08068.1 putative ATP-binding cassette protein subfamily A,member 2 [Trypanosoma rangeli]|eukprot:RNF08068.1 putative ATP-binding cassette protein subfamily A,member 2 [Trypanosoma rangeli]